MDEQTDELALALQPLYRVAQSGRRSSPSPVYRRLPAEILEIIFIHNACDSYYLFEDYEMFSAAAPKCVNVSYVCRHWRDVALNCQTLWTYVPTTSRRWTQELLARSEKAPLKICLTFAIEQRDRLPEYLSIVQQVTSHSKRIQELSISLMDNLNDTDETAHLLFSKFFSSRVPCLQHLQMAGFNLREELLFKGHTPALRTLELEYCEVSWYSLGLSALTHLDLVSQVVYAPFIFNQLNMAQFLAVLRRMPHLIHLSLCYALPGAHDFLSNKEVDVTPTINLSRLSNLSISAPESTIIALLSCVVIPLTTVIKLRCSAFEDSAHAYHVQLATLLAQRISNSDYPTPADPAYHSLLFCNLRGKSLVFGPSTDTSSADIFNFSDHSTQVYFTAPVTRKFDFLYSFCRSIPLTDVQSIHFVPPPLSLDFWRDILGRLPNIRHIKLSQGYMPDIACVLLGHRDSDSNIDRGQHEVLVPALEELELYQIDLSRHEDINVPPPDLQLLFDVISTRKGTRCGLTITKCPVETVGGPRDLDLIGWWDDAKFKVACNTKPCSE